MGTSQLAGRGIDMVFTVILARLLLPRDFGLLAMAALVATFLRIFASLGLGQRIVQRRDIDEEYLSTVFWLNLAAGAVLCLITAAFGRVIAGVMREPIVGVLVLVLSLRFLLAGWAAVQNAMLSRRMNYRVLALISLQAPIIGGLIGVGMAYAGAGVWSLVGQSLGEFVATPILLYRATRWLPKPRFSWSKFMDAWSFGAPMVASRLLHYAVRNVDNLLIGRYLGSAALGFYALGYNVFLTPLSDIGVLVNRVMFSALSRLQDDNERLKRGFLMATQYVTLIALPMMVGIALVAPVFVEVVFGAKWLPTAPVISILALAGFFQLMTTVGPSGLQAAGRPELHLRFWILSLLVYLPAFIVGLRFGIVGVAAGYLIATCVLTPLQFRFVARATGVTAGEMWDAIRAGVVGCAAMAAVVGPVSWMLRSTDLPKVVVLALLIALGALVYGGLIWTVYRQTVLDLLKMARQVVPTSRRAALSGAGEV